ncbi:mobilization protein [Gabonibacter chumensis]|uniref:mobilization protein n=1 Tax=Gabonibacter chumensis TaxID=2972474 RepID=UPI00336A2A61
MAIKSSIHIKPCNISSSEAHNLRTPEYMRNIGESKIYLIPELVADNEHWINPRLGDYDLQTHYDNIKQMVKAKTGRAMQEKERERKTKSGKIIKVAGCSPIREGVLLIKSDTTLEDVRRFGEECQERWGITPLQIFLHKDEGHWLSGKPDADDKESFQIGGRWFKPNYHAHIVFDWMNHETGKSYKLNDDDMTQMQTLLSEILSMERGQSKAETGKVHLERNDFIIEKQRAELERIEAERQHKEHQIDLAEQELKQVKSEIRTDKLKSVATDAATALASGVSSLFGSGKMKSLERKNEDLRDEIAIRDETIEQLQSNIKQMQVEYQKQMQEVKRSYEEENRKQSDYINKILYYFPYVEKLMPMIKYLSEKMGFTDDLIRKLCTFKDVSDTGKLYSSEHNQSFSANGAVCSLKQDREGHFDLNIDGVSRHSWFRRKKDEFMEALGLPTSRRNQNRGLKL